MIMMIMMLVIITYHLGEDLLSREGRALSKYYARPDLHHTQAIWMENVQNQVHSRMLESDLNAKCSQDNAAIALMCRWHL